MKRLELIISQAWQRQSAWLKVLAPLSAIYRLAGCVQRVLYQQSIIDGYHASVPVLVIGNITVGGSGKTPMIIALVRYLQSKKIPVGVISRGYGRKTNDNHVATLVTPTSSPKTAGDEPCLIVQSTNVPMAVCAHRGRAIELLLEHHPNLALIISDDGLQHYALHRDAEWIVVDSARGFGNKKLLPQGFLREPVSRLEGATVIYHHKPHQVCDKALTMYLQPADLVPLLTKNQPLPQSNTVYALSGIGYPTRFFETLTMLGLSVIAQPFADHHEFVLSDLQALSQYPIITTAKDAVKLRQLAQDCPHEIFDNIWVLPVEAVLSKEVYDAMDALLWQWNIDKH